MSATARQHPAPRPDAVQVRGIGKRFPGVIANHDVDITIRAGTVHALIGENGAGKSTLMKILYGVQKPDDGHPRRQRRGGHASPRRPTPSTHGIGMVFQHFMLADNLTVLENVVLGAEKLHGIGDAGPRKIDEISRAYGFGLDPDELVEDLGVGERQRVEILKVLYRGAKIIILDEPTAVLVPQEVDALFDNLRELKAQGHTILFISHKLDEVLAIADDITVMRRGTTVGEAKPEGTTKRQLAELMVGSELPSPETAESTVTDEVLLDGRGRHARRRVRPRAAHRHQPDHPQGRGARHRRRRGQRPGRAGRDDHGHAQADAGTVSVGGKDITDWDTRDRRSAGIGYIPEDRHRHGLLLDAPLWENRILGFQTRPPAAKGFLHRPRRRPRGHRPDRRAVRRPHARASTPTPGRCPAATSRS